jgi:predicted DNA-binding antitoxin AbrB/MazE fold protein
MSTRIESIYEGGVLKPLSPLKDIQEHSKVTIIVEKASVVEHSQARSLVAQGWAGDFDELADAIRRYLESHSSELTESFIRQDLSSGLSGP